MEWTLLEGFFGKMLVLAPFGGTLGALMFVAGAAMMRRQRGRSFTEDGEQQALGGYPALLRVGGWCGAGGIALGALSLAAGLLALLVIAVHALFILLF